MSIRVKRHGAQYYTEFEEFKRFTRKYTYGEVKAMKWLFNRFLYTLKVNTDVVINVINIHIGEPGHKDTYNLLIYQKAEETL